MENHRRQRGIPDETKQTVTGGRYNSTMPDRISAPARRLTRHHRPLPDAVAIHPFAIPQIAPPYDDDAHATANLLTPGFDPPEPPAPGAGRPERREAARDPARQWPSQFAQVLAETLAGARSPSQITPWTTEQARKRISQLGPMLATAHGPRVKRVLVTSPTSGVLEMAVIVGLGTQVRALAVRLERSSGPGSTAKPAGWLCTAVEAA